MLLVFFSLAGGHWAVLHSVTWSEMILEYSSRGSVAEAVYKIFTSEDPCHVCEEAAEEHEKQERHASGRADKKSELFSATCAALLHDPAGRPYLYPSTPEQTRGLRSDAPPRPVPKLS
jgi:hypothetical protein